MVSQSNVIKKFCICAAMIIMAVFCLILSSCDKQEVAKKDAVIYLQEILEDFNNKDGFSVAGKVTYEKETEYTASFDVKNKVVDYKVDDERYRYTDGYLFAKDGESYKVSETGSNYTRANKNIPFNLSLFKYDADKVYAVDYDGDDIVVSFYKSGVAKSFNSDLDVTGGSFTLVISDGKVTSTVLSTTLTKNGKQKSYVAEYSYGEKEDLADITVSPSDDVRYAIYALDKMGTKNAGKTIHTSSQNRDLGASIKVFPTSQDKVNRVFCIKTDDYVSLNIVYNSPTLIEMVHSSVESVQITFDKYYAVTQIIINEGNRYYLS